MTELLRKYDLLKRGVQVAVKNGINRNYMLTRLINEVQELAIECNHTEIFDYTVLLSESFV